MSLMPLRLVLRRHTCRNLWENSFASQSDATCLSIEPHGAPHRDAQASKSRDGTDPSDSRSPLSTVGGWANYRLDHLRIDINLTCTVSTIIIQPIRQRSSLLINITALISLITQSPTCSPSRSLSPSSWHLLPPPLLSVRVRTSRVTPSTMPASPLERLK